MRRTTGYVLFWGALGLMLYTYIGFPILLVLRALLRPRPYRRGDVTPKLSFIIAAHNEAEFICKKLDNALAADYPREQREIIVASDGSDDGTNELVAGYADRGVRLLAFPRQGKNPSLNAAVAVSSGEILVFTDADSMLETAALRNLIAPFADPEVGGVGGDYRYKAARHQGTNERAYWGYDRLLKHVQSQADTMTSATGQLYAIRREYFAPVPAGVTDDFYTSVRPILAHKRLVFEPTAVVSGPVAASDDAEFRRKRRLINRGLNSVWQSRQLLNPADYGFYAVQLFSHKVLRRLMAVPIVAAALGAPLLWPDSQFYRLATLAQAAFHGLALAGYLLRVTRLGRNKLLKLPFGFDQFNLAAFLAFVNLLRGESHDVWVTQRAPSASTQGIDVTR